MSQTAPPLRAAAYIRVSDDAQDKDGTPETRRFRILDYATKRSTELERPIEIVRWYLDVYTGGDSYYDPNRKDFEALKHAIRRRGLDLVLAYKDDRIARGTEFVSFCQELEHFEIKVEPALASAQNDTLECTAFTSVFSDWPGDRNQPG
jgi:DNA invertase Pin-like site-specific DNA recombinase